MTKNVATGKGDMVIANNPENIERIKVLSLQGMIKDTLHIFGDEGYIHYYVVEAGFKYNMMDLQVAIGLHQLRRVNKYWVRRKDIWDLYQSSFCELHVYLPSDPSEDMRHAYHLYILQVKESSCHTSRDEFINKTGKANIGVGVHYSSIPEHPYYNDKFDRSPDNYPHARDLGKQTVSLPLSGALSDCEVDYIIETAKYIVL